MSEQGPTSAKQVTIYGLVDPRDGAIRYVGRTVQPLERRLAQHLVAGGSVKLAWIAELDAQGLKPSITALEVVAADAADAAERRHGRVVVAAGALLTNGEAQPRPWQHGQDQEIITFTLRLPRALYEQLRATAGAEGYTLHAIMLQSLHARARPRRTARAVPVPAAPAPEQGE